MSNIWTMVIVILAMLILSIGYLIWLGKSDSFSAQLIQKQQMEDGTTILTFLLPRRRQTLGLKIGEMLSIKTKKGAQSGSKLFTPIEGAKGSFKILCIPTLPQGEQKQNNTIREQLQRLSIKDKIYVKIIKSNLEYVGGSFFNLKTSDNKQFEKKFKNIYILAEGDKIQIAYQIIQKICEEKSDNKPQITVLFVGGGIADFAFKNEFEHLQENYDNLKYYYSLPIKGQRQPSIAGMGISSQKISETFKSQVSDTFCILCAEQTDLKAVVERALLNMKVPQNHIYKF